MKKIALLLSLIATPALAHNLDPVHISFQSGLMHPFFGLDHVTAMLAIGLWAGVLGARATLNLPVAFVGAMLAGFVIAMTGLSLPMVEPVIAASSVILGLFIASRLSMPVLGAAGIAGGFGLYHGFAHGAEIHNAQGLPFIAGMVMASLLLHLTGLFIARQIGGKYERLSRALGVSVAILGSTFLFAI